MTDYRAQLQDALAKREKSQQEVAQLRNRVAVEAERCHRAEEERALATSRASELESLLGRVCIEHTRALNYHDVFHSLFSSMSQDAVDLSVLRNHQIDQAEGMWVMDEGLQEALLGEVTAKKTLAHWKATIEEACKA